jgi:diguanylate cyclase (GGDEF)-like protein
MSARVVVMASFIAYCVSLIPGVRPSPGFSNFWDVGVNAAVFLGAATVCALRARSTRADRAAWLFIAIGLASYASGTLAFYSYFNRLPEVPYPSPSDGLWLVLYPTAIIGIGLLVRARMAGSVTSMWLDGLVSGLGLVSLSASLVFPRVTAGAGGSLAAIVTNFAYPFLDLALVATVVGAMAAMEGWRDRQWVLLGAGFLTFTAADSWYLLQVAADGYQPGSLVDATYQAAAVLIALCAGSVPKDNLERVARERAEQRSFLVPGIFALVAVAVLVLGAWGNRSSLGILLAVGALTAAWVRTALAVREVVRLADSRRQARTDALTGLPNRRAFYELLDDASTAKHADRSSSVILVDLDRFKENNDALGHQVGDLVLSAVSRRLAGQVPPGVTIARLGGDELAVFAPGMPASGAELVAQRLLDALRDPFVIGDVSLHLGASIGITAIAPAAGVSRALAQADLAMYRAKETRSGYAVYDEAQDGDAWDRLAIVEALRKALAEDGLTVAFQPIVSGGLLQPAGVEALVRWHDPQRGWVSPESFLPLAERAGLMSSVTRRVLDVSLDQAGQLQDLGHRIPVSINFSASDLLDLSLMEYLSSALTDRGLAGAAIRIEITESLLVASAASDFLDRLRLLGIELAVDDYGTGYSCMAYLHELPVSYLKIDRGFTDRILTDDRSAVIVASTIEMAHRLNLKVVAEGVETADQLDWLTAHQCDLIQGYHVSRPLAAQALLTWLSEQQAASLAKVSAVSAPMPGGR